MSNEASISIAFPLASSSSPTSLVPWTVPIMRRFPGEASCVVSVRTPVPANRQLAIFAPSVMKKST